MISLRNAAIAYCVFALGLLAVRDLVEDTAAEKVDDKSSAEKSIIFDRTDQCVNQFAVFKDDIIQFECNVLHKVIFEVESKLNVEAGKIGVKLAITAASAGALGGLDIENAVNATEVATRVLLTPAKTVGITAAQHGAAQIVSEACASDRELGEKANQLVQKVLHKNEALAVTQQTFGWGSLLAVIGCVIADSATCFVDGGAATITALTVSGVIGASNTGVDLAHMTITHQEKEELEHCVVQLCGPIPRNYQNHQLNDFTTTT